jgi:hypothetical protein
MAHSGSQPVSARRRLAILNRVAFDKAGPREGLRLPGPKHQDHQRGLIPGSPGAEFWYSLAFE